MWTCVRNIQQRCFENLSSGEKFCLSKKQTTANQKEPFVFLTLWFSHIIISVYCAAIKLQRKTEAEIQSVRCASVQILALQLNIEMNELTCNRSRMWVNVNKSVNQQQQKQHEILSILNTPWGFTSGLGDYNFRQHEQRNGEKELNFKFR